MRCFSLRAASAGALATLLVFAACSETTDPETSFVATLSGQAEVPPVTTTATGDATFDVSGANLDYTINVNGLSGSATQSHIHVGATNATGPIRLNLCGAGTAPACGAATSGQLVTGTATATELVGITMDELLAQMRNFNAYVNVHTAANGGGEIRGTIIGAP
jgi:hypothetical protein